MATKVSYKQGSKATYLGLTERSSAALYFCTDTRELFKGDDLYSDGLRVVASYDALPAFASAADGILYFCEDTGNGYVLNAARDAWIAVIHGVDNETLEIGATGLIQIKAVPVSSVTGLDEHVESVVEQTVSEMGGVTGDVATPDQAGAVKPGSEFSVDEDGTLTLEAVEISKVSGLEERLSNIEASQVGGVHYKGSVATVDALPADAAQGDLYEVTEDNSEWCWNGEKWFEYGKTADLSPVATATLDEVQFEIDAQKVLHLVSADSGIIKHRGEDLRTVLDELSRAVVWEDMGAEIDPDTGNVAAVLSAASDGDVLNFNEGSVSVAATVAKSATLRGTAAGLHQNFAQEV